VATDSDRRTAVSTALLRGLAGRCPHCGHVSLFLPRRWVEVRETCSSCGLRYLRNQGDPWIFLVVVDRAAFILPVIAVVYFELYPSNLVLLVGAFALLIGAVAATMRQRYGFCLALDYLTRARWRDPDDRLPPLPRTPTSS